MKNTTIFLKYIALFGMSLSIVLAYGTSVYADDIGDEAAQAAIAKKTATDAAEAKREKDKAAAEVAAAKRKAEEAEAARIAKLQNKCEKNGGDWKKGKCVMPPPPAPKPEPKPVPASEPVVVAESPTTPIQQAQTATISHYRVNGDGTVTDTQTGLMWKQCSEGQSGSRCNGTATEYQWDDAMSKFGSSVSFAGYTDWRIPTTDELLTLVYCSNGVSQDIAWKHSCNNEFNATEFETPTINSKVFPNAADGWYWSSIEKNASDALFVNFSTGFGPVNDPKWAQQNIRLVRSGQ